jgi:hypothetical protein
MLLNIRLKMYRSCMSVAGRVADAECREDEFIGIGGKDEIPGVAAQRNQERIRPLCFAPVVRTNRAYHNRSFCRDLPSPLVLTPLLSG